MFNRLVKVIELLLSEEEKAVLDYISVVGQPAIERDFIFFSGIEKMIFKVQNEDQRIVVGPCMVPGMKIPRVDEKTGEVYEVYFNAETVAKAAELFLKQNRASAQNTDHLDNATKDLYLIESWIKESDIDKSTNWGFEDMPIGTWFVKMRVLDDKIWNDIKTGKFKGFSVEGDFLYGETHYESADFNREKFADLYSDLKTEGERKKMDQIIRLLLLDNEQKN